MFKTGIMLLRMVQINKPKWDAWKMLPEAVKSGAVPFALAHGGLDMHQVRPIHPGPCCMPIEPSFSTMSCNEPLIKLSCCSFGQQLG